MYKDEDFPEFEAAWEAFLCADIKSLEKLARESDFPWSTRCCTSLLHGCLWKSCVIFFRYAQSYLPHHNNFEGCCPDMLCKQISKKLRLLTVLASGLVPSSALADIVELSTRDFWVGVETDIANDTNSFIPLSSYKWARPLLKSDPVLSGAVVSFYRRGYSVAEEVSTFRYDILPQELAPKWSRLPGFEIRGIRDHPANLLTYIPVETRGSFQVICSSSYGADVFNLCILRASYPLDDNISLIARLYFPPSPAENPGHFSAVAKRLLEIAYCLDVTEKKRTRAT